MKRFICIILSTLMIFSCFAFTATAADNKAEIKLNGSTYTYTKGSKLVYTCIIDADDKLENGQFILHYPEKVVKITDVDFPIVDAMYNYSENLENMMKFHFSTPMNFYDFKGGKTLVTVNFEVVSTNSGEISLEKIVLSNSESKDALSDATFKETLEGENYVAPKLNMTKKNLFVKQTQKLKVKGGYEESTVKWKSSNTKVATVNKNGKVTAIKAGKANIIAKIDGKKLKCKLVVKNPTVKAEKTTIAVKGKTKIKVSNAVGKTTYKSLTAGIAKVSAKGVVTGLKKGNAKIQVIASGVKFTVKIKVK